MPVGWLAWEGAYGRFHACPACKGRLSAELGLAQSLAAAEEGRAGAMSEQRDWTADRAVCDAACPGPWTWRPTLASRLAGVSKSGDYLVGQRLCGSPPCRRVCAIDVASRADAAFIAAAREGWPVALDEIERLRAVLLAIAQAMPDDAVTAPARAALQGGER